MAIMRGLGQLVDGLVEHDEDLRRMLIVKPKCRYTAHVMS